MKTQTTTDTAILEMEPVQHATPALRASHEVAVPTDSPMSSAMAWIKAGGTMAELRDMLALQKEFEAGEAHKDYTDDMAKFKLNPPKIVKDKQVAFNQNADGTGGTSYMHATIGNVTGLIVAALAEHGFSHRWDTQQKDGGQICVTCTITHKRGHSEATTLCAGADQSGKKNNIQAMASTVTYLQRYTLLAAVGLATNDQEDDDGRGAGGGGYDSKEAVRRFTVELEHCTTAAQLARVRGLAAADFRAANDVAGWNHIKTLCADLKATIEGAKA